MTEYDYELMLKIAGWACVAVPEELQEHLEVSPAELKALGEKAERELKPVEQPVDYKVDDIDYVDGC